MSFSVARCLLLIAQVTFCSVPLGEGRERRRNSFLPPCFNINNSGWWPVISGQQTRTKSLLRDALLNPLQIRVVAIVDGECNVFRQSI
jgi:hypothetical protein